MTKAATLQDVADRAGVSLATASLVLNNRPGISESTAETVRRAMDELAYAPPAPSRRRGTTAGRRRRASTGRIALLLAGQTAPEGLSWQVYMPLVDSLERGLQEHDLSLVLRRDEDLTPTTLNALKQQVDGLVCIGEADPERARRLIHPVPCVWVMGRALHHTWCDRVAIDDRRVGTLAAEYLLGRGHTRLGYLGRFDSFFKLRFEGFRDVLAAHNIEPAIYGLTAENFERAAREETDILDLLVEQLRTEGEPPTGLFVPGDLITNQLYPTLVRHGVRPGRDIDIISTDNVKALRVGMNPQPAAVDIHAERIGARAVGQLAWRLEHPEDPPWQLLIEPHVINPEEIDLSYEL